MVIKHFSDHPISRNRIDSIETLSEMNGSTMSYKKDSEKMDGPLFGPYNYDLENFEIN